VARHLIEYVITDTLTVRLMVCQGERYVHLHNPKKVNSDGVLLHMDEYVTLNSIRVRINSSGKFEYGLGSGCSRMMVVKSEFMRKWYVRVGAFYMDEAEKYQPKSEGVSMNEETWATLCWRMIDIGMCVGKFIYFLCLFILFYLKKKNWYAVI
jgi:hypothetical protein